MSIPGTSLRNSAFARSRKPTLSRRNQMPKKPAQPHPLDVLANGDPKKVIALMLWKARRRQPDLYVKIDEDDLKGFEDCVTYLKVVPEVMIRRPPPIAAQPG